MGYAERLIELRKKLMAMKTKEGLSDEIKTLAEGVELINDRLIYLLDQDRDTQHELHLLRKKIAALENPEA